MGTARHRPRAVALLAAAITLITVIAGAACAACGSPPPHPGRTVPKPSVLAPGTPSAPETPETPPPPPSPDLPGTTAVAMPTSPPAVPPVSDAARADGLVDVRSVVPDAVIDLRYATVDNFTHVQLYPSDARCLVHESMAPGLVTAAASLRRDGLVLVFWDCYRPHAVQVRMFQVVPDPAWVARPGPYARSHESGRSVDVTLALAAVPGTCATSQQVKGRCLLDMGTGFDDFTPRAHAYATAGVSVPAQHNRAILREAMAAGGLAVYSGEWWHFDGPGAAVDRPILTAPVD